MTNLIADIGGTNTRIALCEPKNFQPQHERIYSNADFAAPTELIASYLNETQAAPKSAAFAVAAPVLADKAKLTNYNWEICSNTIARNFNLSRVSLLNDFTALAMAVPFIDSSELTQIGSGQSIAHHTKAIVGPGTGLGVSALIWTGLHWQAIQSEGGNAGFSPQTEQEAELYKLARKDKPFVRSEDLISGTGLPFLYNLLQEIAGHPRAELSAQEITQRASDNDSDCRHTINCFLSMLGHMAGNAALTFGATGGVYIGGGVMRHIAAFIEDSPFRASFESKGPFTEFVAPIATYLLPFSATTALIGTAAFLNQQEQS